jgi:hypothetical protein
VGENRKFEFKLFPENPLLFSREGGRGMSSKTLGHKNNVNFNLTWSRQDQCKSFEIGRSAFTC